MVNFLCFLLGISYVSVFISEENVKTGTLEVLFQTDEQINGNILVAIYNSGENFMNEDKIFRSLILENRTERQPKCVIADLPFGDYALAAFIDINGNKALDNTILGIPKEPYGFSNNHRVKWNKPDYKSTVFQFQEENSEITVILKQWKDW